MENAFIHDRERIAQLIPHAGSMCLLDGVEQYDDDRIVCRASSHLDDDNPLRNAGRLGIAIGIEYAAQAMAIHGALRDPPEATPKVGYLASVRNVEMHSQRLDRVAAPLHITATRLSGNATTGLYRFEIHADRQLLMQGRAAVIVAADALSAGAAG